MILSPPELWYAKPKIPGRKRKEGGFVQGKNEFGGGVGNPN